MSLKNDPTQPQHLISESSFRIYLIEPMMEGINNSINNSCNQLAQLEKQLRESDDETQQLILIKSQEVIDEVQQLSKVVKKLSVLLNLKIKINLRS
jgi:hypothetical protein